MLLTVKGVKHAFGVQTVLDGISFQIDEKEKCAVVGVNGAGKTTLFKIITGELKADAGEVVFAKDATMGYLSQMTGLSDGNTVYDEMLAVFADMLAMEAEMRALEAEMGGLAGDKLASVMSRYAKLTHEYEARRGYEVESRIRGVIKGLSFADEDSAQPIGTFSGGQKTRLAMAKLLLTEPDLLLLDEPTNHLDIAATQWLEEFLRNYKGAVVIISHDRYFLDQIATKVIEIEHEKATCYSGNYTAFVEKKETNREIALKHYVNQQREIKRQEEVIRLLKSFNREKSIKRAESREKLLAKVERVEKPAAEPETMRVLFTPRRESGNDVLFVEAAAKAFGDVPLFRDVSFNIYKGEKAALIGQNGIGKTTLFRMIQKEISMDAGKVRFGTGVVSAYYDQEHHNIDPEKTIFQEISDTYPKMTVFEIRSALGAFVFTGDDVNKPISTLSGGERGRVALCKIMLGNANFLILDEPTNHLDIFSKEVLESALRKYTGTVLYISHDRYFINSTATKTIELTPAGAVTFNGNYDFMLEQKAKWAKEGEKAETVVSAVKEPETKAEWARKKEEAAEARKLQARISRMEKEIARLEQRIRALDEQLMAPDLGSDALALSEIYTQKQQAEDALFNLYDEWERVMEETDQ